jgi:hypothetical protein
MNERHLHTFDVGKIKKKVSRTVKEKGLRGVASLVISFAICPGDDLVAVGASLVPGGDEVVVHQAILPSEENLRIKTPEVSRKGKRIH